VYSGLAETGTWTGTATMFVVTPTGGGNAITCFGGTADQ
jgi:hypothetical protein